MSALLIAVILVVLVAAFVQGVMGFGSGAISMALLPLLMPISDAVAVVSVICLCINACLLIKLWAAISWRPLVPLALGATLGVPLGVSFLKSIDEGQLQITLGAVMLLYAAVKLSASSLLERTISDRWGLAFGAVGGALGAASNVGGPPLIIYVTMKDWGRDQTKATLQAFFLVISLIQVPAFVATGVLRTDHLPLIAAGVPALLLGVWAGSRLYDGVGAGHFAKLMVWFLGLIGLFYVARGSLA
jgi:uncharacterized membrane protein YfcA